MRLYYVITRVIAVVVAVVAVSFFTEAPQCAKDAAAQGAFTICVGN